MQNTQYAALPLIYDAAMSQEHWPAALDMFSKSVGARASVLLASDTAGYPFSIRQSSTLYPCGAQDYYVGNLAKYEVEAWKALQGMEAEVFLKDSDVWPDTENLKKRPDYKWMLENFQIFRRMATKLNDKRAWSDTLSVQFDQSLEMIPDASIESAQLLLPHIAKVVEISRSFGILRMRFDAVLTALDHVKVGVCIARQDGELIIVNDEANRIFDLKDGLTLNAGKKILSSSSEIGPKIKEAIVKSSATSRGEHDAHQFIIAAPRNSAGDPFLMEVTPLRDSSKELEPGVTGAMVTIIDPDNPRPFSTAHMRTLFKLTESESSICAHIVEGLTNSRIAEMRNVSTDTVKTQVSSVMQKTRTKRRSDLIRLALAVNPPIDSI